MEASKVLVIGNENFLALLKNTANYQYVLSKTYNDALSKLRNTQFDVVVILYSQTISGLLNFAKSLNTSVLLVCKLEIYDQVLYQCKDSGIIVLSYPIKKQVLYEAFQMLMSLKSKIAMYEKKINKLEQKYLELKMVDHCKLVLISNYHWSEEKAHHYIEKNWIPDPCTDVVSEDTKRLPQCLEEAKLKASNSTWLKEVLGKDVVDIYVG